MFGKAVVMYLLAESERLNQLAAVTLFLACSAAGAQTFSFQPTVTYPAQGAPVSTATADFNGDGKPDLAVANAGAGTVTIFLGKGDGTFTNTATVTLPDECLDDSITAGDFNNDGNVDLLAVCGFQTKVWVLPGLGTGQFGTPIPSFLPQDALNGLAILDFHSVAVADFNRDGKLDLVVITSNTLQSNGILTPVQLSLLLGNGDGTFQAAISILPANFAGFNVVTADFNGDGNPDLAVDSYQIGSTDVEAANILILLGDGKGGFTNTATYSLPGAVLAGSMIVADVNGDGIPDLIAASAIGPSSESLSAFLTVLTGNGDGTFKQLPSTNQSAPSFRMVAGDFRVAGTADLVQEVVPSPGTKLSIGTITMTIRAGNGDGTFQSPVPISVPSVLAPFWFDMAVGDWNGDGTPDLAFTASPSSAVLSRVSGTEAGAVVEAYQALPAGDLVVMLNNLPPTVPVIALTSRQLQFAGVSGGANPPSQSVTVSNTGAGTLNWTATSSARWLTVTPTSGTGTGTLTISAAPGNMPAAAYPATISIAAAGADNSPQTISVSFAVTAPSNLPTITGVVNGASFLPGIESGSWVTIQGSNLSNTNPGRIWTPAEIINGNLPTSLDGTSVTIDGKPAYVYYISPAQLNVQAPTDASTGSVRIVVTNNGQVSVAFMAQLQTYTPALFLYTNTSYAIASHYPDYALVGNPSVIAGTIAAQPGDVLILWATGFGPTNPATPAGIEVVTASSVAMPPTITIGGVPVTVLSAVISPGSAGLYQIAIQLPATAPTGAVAIQASVAGVQSPGGVLIFVAGQ